MQRLYAGHLFMPKTPLPPLTAKAILAILDRCANDFTFPMLDNGYFYLAATRLALFRAPVEGALTDWAIVIETFGFSPRNGHPDTVIQTYASRLHARNPPDQYASAEAYQNYLVQHPHDEYRSIQSLDLSQVQDPENCEHLCSDGHLPTCGPLRIRGQQIPAPTLAEFERAEIQLQDPPNVRVFELCRLLAAQYREQLLATSAEQRMSVLPGMERILQLEEWHHPDVVVADLPSDSPTFVQLAEVLESGKLSKYRPRRKPNTHWRNWPDGGSL
jgi:hypothetical protein